MVKQVKIPKEFNDPKYKGRHLILIAGKIFSAKTGKEAARIFDKVTKRYPGKIPTITYIPKNETLILWF